MSIASPQNRKELKEYIKTKLGAPVLQINVSDEQMDLAINDAFQYFFEKEHFDASERVFLSTKVNPSMQAFFATAQIDHVHQSTNQTISANGMVDSLLIQSGGTGFPLTTFGSDSDYVEVATKTTGNGSGLTVTVSEGRTADGGITGVHICNTGSGYVVGDDIIVPNHDEGTNALFTVVDVKTSSPLYGHANMATQNNYLILPKGVIGVNRIISRRAGGYGGGMIPGVAFFNPFLAGGIGGMPGAGMNFDLTSYYAMNQYIATLEWMMYPPISYSFNRRTHRLFIDSDNFNGLQTNDWLLMECQIEANPDFFPDVWNDLFLKRLATAYVQLAWGRVLSKYQQVQLPGGITMNGEQILNDAKDEITNIQERFAYDYASPPLDIVG